MTMRQFQADFQELLHHAVEMNVPMETIIAIRQWQATIELQDALRDIVVNLDEIMKTMKADCEGRVRLGELFEQLLGGVSKLRPDLFKCEDFPACKNIGGPAIQAVPEKKPILGEEV